MDKANAKRARAEANQRQRAQSIRDRRRFKFTGVATGEVSAGVDPSASRTKHLNTVLSWDFDTDETIFKDGANNVKLGGDVLIGDLRGAKIVTLSLEERATCPRSCVHWTTCYGNNMHRARRWAYGPMLTYGMAGEIRRLCCAHPGVLVRLHTLGDFPDKKYIDWWESQLRLWPNLFCFGFTAHRPSTAMGRAIAKVRNRYKGSYSIKSRFAIRHSGVSGEWGSFTIDYPTTRRKIADALCCPEQVDADLHPERKTHCGSCAACWQSSVPIVFREH